MKPGLWLLLLLLSGEYEARAGMNTEHGDKRTDKGKICLLSDAWKDSMMKRQQVHKDAEGTGGVWEE